MKILKCTLKAIWKDLKLFAKKAAEVVGLTLAIIAVIIGYLYINWKISRHFVPDTNDATIIPVFLFFTIGLPIILVFTNQYLYNVYKKCKKGSKP